MFHWICPECGREIAPTVRECPVCDPVAATVETALAGEVEAPARAEIEVATPVVTVETSATEMKPEADPDQLVVPVAASAPTIQPAPLAVEIPAPVAAPIDAAPPALATRIESVSPLAARSSPSSTMQDAVDRADALLPQFGAPSGGGDPLAHLSSMLVSSMLDASPHEPPPSQDALALPMRAASNVPTSLRAFIAELRPVGAEPRVPLTPDRPR